LKNTQNKPGKKQHKSTKHIYDPLRRWAWLIKIFKSTKLAKGANQLIRIAHILFLAETELLATVLANSSS